MCPEIKNQEFEVWQYGQPGPVPLAWLSGVAAGAFDQESNFSPISTNPRPSENLDFLFLENFSITLRLENIVEPRYDEI